MPDSVHCKFPSRRTRHHLPILLRHLYDLRLLSIRLPLVIVSFLDSTAIGGLGEFGGWPGGFAFGQGGTE
jgi:hypothetical protein